MDPLGKPTISPLFYYTGKLAGYVIIALPFFMQPTAKGKELLAITWYDALQTGLTILGLIFIVAGLFWLGSSTRVGLPEEETVLKTGGIYRLTRNPIYVGLHIMVIGAMLYLFHPVVFIFGLYSIVVYHYIILSEEKFLSKRFGESYRVYLDQTSRYLGF